MDGAIQVCKHFCHRQPPESQIDQELEDIGRVAFGKQPEQEEFIKEERLMPEGNDTINTILDPFQYIFIPAF